MFAKRTASALVIGAALLTASAGFAAETAAPAPAAAPTPASSAADQAADNILSAMGVKRTLEIIIPGMMAEFEQNVATTRPDIRESLRQTLQSIKPEYDKQALDIYNKSVALLTSMMSEKELVDVSTFFSSPSGKKYLATEPVFFQRFNELMAPWRQQISSDIVTKARDEMKKKGIDF